MRRSLPVLLLCGVTFAALAVPAPDTALPPRLLAVVASPTGNDEVFLVNPDSGDIRNLTNNPAADAGAVWSADGKMIAFQSDRDGTVNVYVMALDGTGLKQVTKEASACHGPRWSPDGKKIAFINGKNGVDNIYVVEVATGRTQQLTSEELASRQPAWSPDGKKISYSYYGPGPYDTWVMDSDGTNKKNLTNGSGGLDAAWSPDGKRIAFTSIRANLGGFHVYVMDPDGGNVKQLSTNDNGIGNVFPDWSPDGKKVVFTDSIEGVLQVAVVGVDGQGHAVLNSKGTSAIAKWSPDGKKIAFVRTEENQPAALIVCDADGQNAREVMRSYSSSAWRPTK